MGHHLQLTPKDTENEIHRQGKDLSIFSWFRQLPPLPFSWDKAHNFLFLRLWNSPLTY